MLKWTKLQPRKTFYSNYSRVVIIVLKNNSRQMLKFKINSYNTQQYLTLHENY